MDSSKKLKWAMSFLGLAVFIVVGFQNCAPLDFTGDDDVAPVNISGDEDLPNDPPGENPCKEDETWDGNLCLKPTDMCKAYKEIVPVDGVVTIPARGVNQICYYMKIFDRVEASTSDEEKPKEDQVISAKHSVNAGVEQNKPRHPIILSKKEFKLVLQGPRYVRVNSSPDAEGTTNLKIDNFLLGQFETSTSISFLAAGTRDSEFIDADGSEGYDSGTGVRVLNPRTSKWQTVQFVPFEAGGTANIEDVKLDNFVQLNALMKIKLWALDCGWGQDSSEGYLIFK